MLVPSLVLETREFKQLIEYYSGPQARYYYAQMLHTEHQNKEAIAQLETVMLLARRAKPHYRKYHKQFLRRQSMN